MDFKKIIFVVASCLAIGKLAYQVFCVLDDDCDDSTFLDDLPNLE